MNFEFAIPSWAAYAPGLTTTEQWQAWSAHACLPTGDGQPALIQIEPMVRRRLGALGRMAAEVAYSAHDADIGIPVVWCSRYGDSEKALALLNDLSRDEALSPTAFGLSVHNAIGAMYSMARGDRSNYLSVAAGAASVMAGVVEAAGLLSDGAPAALLVCYDAPLPQAYRCFEDEPAASFAWAWRMTPPVEGRPRWRFSAGPASQDEGSDTHLPLALDLLRFFLSGHALWQRQAGGTLWTVQRHG